MKNANKPINPTTSQKINETEFFEYNLPNKEKQYSGLTKREYFAGLAMQGMISNPNIVRPKESDKEFKDFSERAIKYADELLKQLEEKYTHF